MSSQDKQGGGVNSRLTGCYLIWSTFTRRSENRDIATIESSEAAAAVTKQFKRITSSKVPQKIFTFFVIATNGETSFGHRKTHNRCDS